MPFLDEIDSIKAKLHLSGIRKPILVGLACAVLIIAGIAGTLVVTTMQDAQSIPQAQDELVVEEDEQPSSIFVHVSGCVVSPGVYEVTEGARVKEAIDAAGGFTDTADRDSVNLARVINDGEQIIIADQNAAQQVPAASNADVPGAAPGKININTATAEELMALDGVGEATAEKIITYREDNGGFQTIEDIMNVSGIGEKKFEAMKDQIVV